MVTRKINIANPHDRSMVHGTGCYGWRAYIMAFGAYGSTYVLAYASDLESALEEAAEWLADNAPGHIMEYGADRHTALVREACEDAGLAWPMPEDWCEDSRYVRAVESAEADLTYTEAGWITSYEWTIVGENMSPREISDFAHGR